MEKTFGQILKSLRKEKKMTQKMLCEDICSQSVLSRIEGDIELPNVLVVQQLCDRLGVSIDQVVNHKSVEMKDNFRFFEQLADLYRHNRFEELEKKILESDIFMSLYAEREFQLYYYYLGSCEYYLYHNLEKALYLLKNGLSYVAKVSHLTATNEDVQLISCIGKVYAEMGKTSEGEYYLKRSISLFEEIPIERATAESIKIFYNYACYLQMYGYYETSKEMIDKGIRLARHKNSFYFLDALFDLKALYYRAQKMEEEADRYQVLAELIREIDEIH